MLKGKRSVSACSLSSCRIRAEALARAFNSRIWPCVWMQPRSSPAEREDGMSNGIDDDEEFFDASPSPVEVEDESFFCQQHSSAATEAGRAKLYELLQQHATDDAIDVFYDVTEDAGLSDTCLKDEAKESEVRDSACQPSQCPRQLDDESYFSNTSDSNGVVDNECTFSNGSQNICEPVENELQNNLDSKFYEEHKKNNLYLEKPVTQQTIAEDGHKSSTETNFDKPEYRYEHPSQTENMGLVEDEKVSNQENVLNEKHGEASEYSSKFEDKVLNEYDNISKVNDSTSIDLPSVESNFLKQNGNQEGVLNISDECILKISIDDEKCVANAEVNNVAIEITLEAESPSTSPTDKDVKTSPTCRLKVFDEIRPKIIRTTSLKTGKTPPGTPSRKKIVRFADVLGLDLEDVRHIMSGDLPIIPSSAYTDLNLTDADMPSSGQTSETIEISRRDTSSWQIAAAIATNGLYPMFPIPGEQPDFMDRLRFQGVCLDTLIVSEMTVQCTCRVMNYGYHKKVTARYTFNDWLSSNDIDASYMLGSSNFETDSFSFSIFLSPQNKNVKFALKYEVNGKEYWDNNRGLNYCLSYHGTDHMQQLPSPESWQHQFW